MLQYIDELKEIKKLVEMIKTDILSWIKLMSLLVLNKKLMNLSHGARQSLKKTLSYLGGYD